MPKEVSFKAGELIFHEGDPGGSLFIILEGTVEVYRTHKGQEFHLTTLTKGELLGAMTATNSNPRSASVRAETMVKAKFVSKEEVNKLMDGLPKLGMILINDLVSRVEHGNNLYIDSSLRGGKRRDTYPAIVASLHMANHFVDLSATFTKSIDGHQMVVTGEIFDNIQRALDSDLTQYNMLKEMFFTCGVIELRRLSTPGDYIFLEDVDALRCYIQVAEQHLKGLKEDSVDLNLAKGEREYLRNIAKLGSHKLSGQNRIVDVPLKAFMEDLRASNIQYNAEMFKRAETFELISLKKSSSSPQLTFEPFKIMHTINSLEMLIKLELKDSTTLNKRTLVY